MCWPSLPVCLQLAGGAQPVPPPPRPACAGVRRGRHAGAAAGRYGGAAACSLFASHMHACGRALPGCAWPHAALLARARKPARGAQCMRCTLAAATSICSERSRFSGSPAPFRIRACVGFPTTLFDSMRTGQPRRLQRGHHRGAGQEEGQPQLLCMRTAAGLQRMLRKKRCCWMRRRRRRSQLAR